MREKLTQKDIEKIQQEIDHRKLVVRKEAIEAGKEITRNWAKKAIYWITIFAGISREKSGIFQGFGTRTKRREEKVELFYKAIDFYNKSC